MTTLVVVAFVVAAIAGARGTWSPCGLSMISAINPVSERARGNRFWLTTMWFVAGAVCGGAVLGAGSAVLAWGVDRVHASAAVLLAAGAVAALVALASDARVGGFTLPIHPRQVNERWLDGYRRWVYAAGFGVQIGSGFATYIMTAATYLVVALAALSGSPTVAFATGLTFGLVRGLAVVLSARAQTMDRLFALHRRLEALAPWSLAVAMAAEAGAALGLAGCAHPIVGTVLALVAVVSLVALSQVPTPLRSGASSARAVTGEDRARLVRRA